MKRTIPSIALVALLVAIVTLSGCITTPPARKPIPPDYSVIRTGMNDVVNSSNEFSFKMYKELSTSDGNVFFSPYSLSTALGMAYEGARGATAIEMAQVLDLPIDDRIRWDMVEAIQSRLNKDGSSYELSTANAYWLVEGGQLEQEYKQVIDDYYLAHGDILDFIGDPEGSVNTINEWVEGRTNNKIQDLLSVNDIDPWTYLILTNAIYFKSDWKYQFDPEATKDRDFTLSNGNVIQTATMHMCDESKKLNYASNDAVQLLQLPYKNEELSMFVLLPKANDIASFEANLDHSYLSNLKDDITAEYVDLYLPKFTFEQKYELKQALCALGMPTAFTGGADFSGITSDGGLSITKVIHQSFVEVNEEGTEAAAATAVVMGKGVGSSPPEAVVFRADHPFIVIIQHDLTGQILFMGKVENPSG